MQAGRMRHRLTLEAPVEVQDTYGDVSAPTWVSLETFWGSVEPLSGRELILAEQTQADISHRIRRRYRAGIIPKWRITLGTRHFDILSVIDRDERHVELEIMCKELV